MTLTVGGAEPNLTRPRRTSQCSDRGLAFARSRPLTMALGRRGKGIMKLNRLLGTITFASLAFGHAATDQQKVPTVDKESPKLLADFPKPGSLKDVRGASESDIRLTTIFV